MKKALCFTLTLLLLFSICSSAFAATAVKQVKLNKTSLSLEVGKTFQLKATYPRPMQATRKWPTPAPTKTWQPSVPPA